MYQSDHLIKEMNDVLKFLNLICQEVSLKGTCETLVNYNTIWNHGDFTGESSNCTASSLTIVHLRIMADPKKKLL